MSLPTTESLIAARLQGNFGIKGHGEASASPLPLKL